MRLARKFGLTLSCAILAVLATTSAIDVQRELALFEEEIRVDNQALGHAIATATANGWRLGGEEEARKAVEETNAEASEVTVRLVWLDGSGSDRPEVPSEQLATLTTDGRAFVRWQPTPDSGDFLYTYLVLPPPTGGRAGAIEVRESLEDEEDYVRRTVVQAAVATIALVLICGFLAFALGTWQIGRPVRQLVEYARRIGSGDLSGRIPVARTDELGELADEMNAMCKHLSKARESIEAETRARLATLEQLRHADRLTTIGKLASGIAHELGTPLNVITGHARLISDEHARDSAAHSNAAVIAQQAQRVAGIIRQLLDFARRRTPQKAGYDLAMILDQVAALLRPTAHGQRCELRVTWGCPQELRAMVDPEQIKQALINIVLNSLQAMPEGGTVTLTLDRGAVVPPPECGYSTADYLSIRIEDQGCGIPPDVLPRIFEPFVTTKDPGEGTGLGLSVAYDIVKEHEGWIEVCTQVGKGACFTLYLPAEKDA
jgi:two-component system, NtrC family, sensor kinase